MSLINLKNDYDLAKISELKVPVQLGNIVCCMGRRAVGKTTLCKNLLSTLVSSAKVPPHVIIAAANDDYKGWSNNIYSEASDEFLSKIFEYQRQAVKNNNVRDLILVLDDVIQNTKSPQFSNIVFNGRHVRITLILAVAHPRISREIRSHIDMWFVRETGGTDKNFIWQYIFGYYPTFAEFTNVFDGICSNPWTWTCTINSTAPSKTFWFTAKLNPDPYVLPLEDMVDLDQALKSSFDLNDTLASLRDELNDTISKQVKIRQRLDALLK